MPPPPPPVVEALDEPMEAVQPPPKKKKAAPPKEEDEGAPPPPPPPPKKAPAKKAPPKEEKKKAAGAPVEEEVGGPGLSKEEAEEKFREMVPGEIVSGLEEAKWQDKVEAYKALGEFLVVLGAAPSFNQVKTTADGGYYEQEGQRKTCIQRTQAAFLDAGGSSL